MELKSGQKYILKNDGTKTNEFCTTISYSGLYNDLNPDDKILIDDGSIELKVEYIENEEIHCIVIEGGTLISRKSVNIPGVYLNNPTLSQKDIDDLKYAVEADFEYVAASFVRNKNDILAIKKVLNENGGNEIEIIAKIENQQALENLDEILEVSDGVMIARGDFAVEIPFYEVPIWQKQIIIKSNEIGKPVIVATQMLESMIKHSTPTRAEASDVANAVYDKASAVMLSAETAVGNYPIKCVETMANICKSVESKIRYWERIKDTPITKENMESDSAKLIVYSARKLEANYIIAYTHTGHSVRKIAGLRSWLSDICCYR